MNRQELNTILTLRMLDVPLDLKTFSNRLIIQKSIYLAQAGGHDCGHFFRWYLRGPYSPELSRDAFSIKAEIDADLDDSKRWDLDSAAIKRLERVRRLIPSGDPEAQSRKLELLASVHFLIARKQVSRVDANQIVRLLKAYNKDYQKAEVEDAIKELCDCELLAN